MGNKNGRRVVDANGTAVEQPSHLSSAIGSGLNQSFQFLAELVGAEAVAPSV